MNYTYDLVSLLSSTLFVIVLSFFVWRQRSDPGTFPLLALLLLRGLWIILWILQLFSPPPNPHINWSVLSNAINPLIFAAGFSIVYEFTNQGKWLDHRNILFSILPSAIFSLLILVENYEIMWLKTWMVGVEDILENSLVLIFFAFYLFYFSLSTLLLVRLSHRWPLYRWSLALILLGLFTSGVIDILKAFGRIPVYTTDISILAHDITLLILVLSVLWLRFIDVMVLARNAAIENLQDGMLVLDLKDRIDFINPTAQKILTSPWAESDDQAKLRSNSDGLIALALNDGDKPVKILVQNGHGLECYILHSMYVADPYSRPIGKLVVLQNVTEIERAQKQLLSQHYALAVAEERARVARELHDDLGQVLGYMKLQAQAALELQSNGQQESAHLALEQLVSVAQNTNDDIRRYIYANQNIPIAQQKFLPALQQFLEQYSKTFKINVQLDYSKESSFLVLDPNIQIQLMRIVQEALNNAQKHSMAACLSVCVALMDGYLHVAIEDDGQGFDPAQLHKQTGISYGLDFMQQRAEMIGGSLEIHSAPNQGTCVTVQLPLDLEIERSISLMEKGLT